MYETLKMALCSVRFDSFSLRSRMRSRWLMAAALRLRTSSYFKKCSSARFSAAVRRSATAAGSSTTPSLVVATTAETLSVAAAACRQGAEKMQGEGERGARVVRAGGRMGAQVTGCKASRAADGCTEQLIKGCTIKEQAVQGQAVQRRHSHLLVAAVAAVDGHNRLRVCCRCRRCCPLLLFLHARLVELRGVHAALELELAAHKGRHAASLFYAAAVSLSGERCRRYRCRSKKWAPRPAGGARRSRSGRR